jgi:hypothetical protein
VSSTSWSSSGDDTSRDGKLAIAGRRVIKELEEAARLRAANDTAAADRKLFEAFDITPTGAVSSPQPAMPQSLNAPPIHDYILKPTPS